LPNVIKIDPYNFELYRFKLGAFFLRHSVYNEIRTTVLSTHKKDFLKVKSEQFTLPVSKL